MDRHHVGGSEFASTVVLKQVHQLNNKMNETLNNWKNGVDDEYFNSIINGGAAVDEKNNNYFYVHDEL